MIEDTSVNRVLVFLHQPNWWDHDIPRNDTETETLINTQTHLNDRFCDIVRVFVSYDYLTVSIAII